MRSFLAEGEWMASTSLHRPGASSDQLEGLKLTLNLTPLPWVCMQSPYLVLASPGSTAPADSDSRVEMVHLMLFNRLAAKVCSWRRTSLSGVKGQTLDVRPIGRRGGVEAVRLIALGWLSASL